MILIGRGLDLRSWVRSKERDEGKTVERKRKTESDRVVKTFPVWFSWCESPHSATSCVAGFGFDLQQAAALESSASQSSALGQHNITFPVTIA